MNKVIQITDAHIVPDGQLVCKTSDTTKALIAAVETIIKMLPRIGPVDLVIITGDLCDIGRKADYRHFRDIMEKMPVPWCAVPGNHDNRAAMRAIYGDQGWMPKQGAINWCIELDDFAVIGIDSLTENAHYGSLPAPTLLYLEKTLQSLKGKPALIGLHHPPFQTGIEEMDADNLRSPGALMEILDRHKGETRLVCGHVHRSITTLFGTSVALIAPSIAHAVTLDLQKGSTHSLVKEPGGIMLHEWRDGFVSHIFPVRHVPKTYPF